MDRTLTPSMVSLSSSVWLQDDFPFSFFFLLVFLFGLLGAQRGTAQWRVFELTGGALTLRDLFTCPTFVLGSREGRTTMRVGATTAALAVAVGAWLANADVEVVVDRTCSTDSIFDTTKLGCYSCDGYFDIDGKELSERALCACNLHRFLSCTLVAGTFQFVVSSLGSV